MARTVVRPARPYLGQPELDDLMRINAELLAELWILRDRVTVLEHLLEQQQVLDRRVLDDYVPEGALAAELERERDALVRRVAGAALRRQGYSVDGLKAEAPPPGRKTSEPEGR